MKEIKHYAERDIIGQGPVYVAHVNAMTAESLHAKSDIAAELAHRDLRIMALERALGRAADALHESGYLREAQAATIVLVPPPESPP